MLLRILLALGCFGFSLAVLGQAASNQAASAPPSPAAELDLYVKVIGGAVAALATLLGLPIVFLTYRKTRAEIAKLDLEAAALRQGTPSPSGHSAPSAQGIQINVTDSPNVNVQVLADPRFLAPLLLLLDFIFAWVVLTLAGYVLSIFGIGILRNLALTALAAVLLLPIVKQVVRVRTLLRPSESQEEANTFVRQAQTVVYGTYLIAVISPLVFGGLVLALEPDSRYIAWSLIALGLLLAICIPLVKSRVDRYLVGLLDPASDGRTGA